jgi:hypothetical protein
MFFINPFILSPAGGDFESIATVTVGSGGAANIEFTSIPGTYQHLQVRFIGQCADTASSGTGQNRVSVTLNADTTNANYAIHQLFGNGSTAGAYAETSSRLGFGVVPRNSITSFAGNVVDLLDYANTSKNTTIRAFGGYDANGSGIINLLSVLWMNTNAVTSIKLEPESATNFKQYSTAALYGVKAP